MSIKLRTILFLLHLTIFILIIKVLYPPEVETLNLLDYILLFSNGYLLGEHIVDYLSTISTNLKIKTEQRRKE